MLRILISAIVAGLLAPPGVAGFRTHFSEKLRLQESQRVEPEVSEAVVPPPNASEAPFSIRSLRATDVDFSFMTANFGYQGPRPSIWSSWRKFRGGGRPEDDLEKGSWQPEIVAGHSCRQSSSSYNAQDAKRTYYAQSMCYWIPQHGYKQTPKDNIQGSRGLGLTWSGQQLCQSPGGISGQCVKCAVCHNNGRHAQGSLNHAASFEVLSLPAGCLQESQIERINLDEFTGNHTDLAEERAECNRLQADIHAAQHSLNANLQSQVNRKNRINSLLATNQSYRSELSQKQSIRPGEQDIVDEARALAHAQCKPFCGETWCSMLPNEAHTAGQVLAQWPSFDCEEHRNVQSGDPPQAVCRSLRQIYLAAEERLNSNLQSQVTYQRNVDTKQAHRDSTEGVLAEKRATLVIELQLVNGARNQATCKCEHYGGQTWCQRLSEFQYTAGQVLGGWPNMNCRQPQLGSCDETLDPGCTARLEEEYRLAQAEFEECSKCSGAKPALIDASRQYEDTERRITGLENDLNRVNSELNNARSLLQGIRDQEPGLRAALQTASNNYFPKKAKCDEECFGCRSTKTRLQGDWNQLVSTDNRIAELQRLIPQNELEIAAERGRLKADEDAEPGLRQVLADTHAAMAPKKERCDQDLLGQYEVLKRIWLLDSIPKMWSRSCEKACLDMTRDAPCGIIEGVAQGEVSEQPASAGMDVTCAPAYSSFVKTPERWGSERETEAEVCSRILEHQQPKRAQEVVIKGELWKRGGLFRKWQKRYFVFESDDEVRSAVIRYWVHFGGAEQEERAEKTIILWDAVSVRPQAGSKYGWKGGEECFLLQHFYRDYRLCVPGILDANRIRDRWVNNIAAAIRFPSRPPAPSPGWFR